MTEAISNKRLVLIVGESGTGKTASLRELEDQEGVLYLNCEAGKEIPFRNKFVQEIITDPLDMLDILEEAEESDEIHTIVIDSLSLLMEMYESVHVLTSTDTRAAWGNYAQFFRELMQSFVANSKKRYIILAHTDAELNKDTGIYEVKVPVKGQLKKISVEAYFSIIVAAKKLRVKELEGYKNDMLDITKREKTVGFKHVFQTLPTKETVGERMRGPFDLWEDEQTFIDNNAQMLLDYVDDYYNS